MPLIDELRSLAEALVPADVAGPNELGRLLGALLLALDHAGLKVAPELFPKEPTPAAAAAVERAAPGELAKLMDDFAGRVERILGRFEAPPEPVAPEPVAPALQPVVPYSFSTSPAEPSPPATNDPAPPAATPAQMAGPAAPPSPLGSLVDPGQA